MQELDEFSQLLEGGYTYIRPTQSDVRKISDPIYDFVYFGSDIWKIIDTPVYQRLRHIKQLGTTNWVFQGANHTRFEHCLGVGHLAQQFITSIYKNQPSLDAKEDKERNIKLVSMAGILHDLGHGPFSHMFDNILIPKLTTVPWSHEDASDSLFRYLCDTHYIDLSQDDQNFVCALIQGDSNRVSNGKVQWLYDIVSNKRNGIDVDRIDYIRRDCHHLGQPQYIKDFKFLMDEARVIGDEICYPQKYALNIFDLFNTRYKLFKTVYLNRVSQAIEQMMCDILLSVNDTFHFDEIIFQPEKYYKLNDTIIEQIDNTENPKFEKAQKIISRLKHRDLYKFVSEVLVSDDTVLDSNDKIRDDIAAYITEPVELDQIYVSQGKVGYGSKNDNPIDRVSFYRKANPDSKFHLANGCVSYCLPTQFSEKFIRVFVSNSTIVQIVETGFENYCKVKLGSKPQNQDRYQTPTKKPTDFSTALRLQKTLPKDSI